MRTDPKRLALLQQCMLMDAAPDRILDDLARLLADALQVPIAMVNLLDERRDWFPAVVGLPLRESPAETSFCEVFFDSGNDVVLVPDTATDPRLANHPLVRGVPHIRFYAGARLVVREHTLGTLCAYDLQPRTLSAAQIDQLKALANAAVQRLVDRLEGTVDRAAV